MKAISRKSMNSLEDIFQGYLSQGNKFTNYKADIDSAGNVLTEEEELYDSDGKVPNDCVDDIVRIARWDKEKELMTARQNESTVFIKNFVIILGGINLHQVDSDILVERDFYHAISRNTEDICKTVHHIDKNDIPPESFIFHLPAKTKEEWSNPYALHLSALKGIYTAMRCINGKIQNAESMEQVLRWCDFLSYYTSYVLRTLKTITEKQVIKGN